MPDQVEGPVVDLLERIVGAIESDRASRLAASLSRSPGADNPRRTHLDVASIEGGWAVRGPAGGER